jgi:hypothetical protein
MATATAGLAADETKRIGFPGRGDIADRHGMARGRTVGVLSRTDLASEEDCDA